MHQLVSCDPTAQDEPEKKIKKIIFFLHHANSIHLNVYTYIDTYVHIYIYVMYKLTHLHITSSLLLLLLHTHIYTHTLTHIYPVDFCTQIASQFFSGLWTTSLLSIKLIFSPLMGVITPMKRKFFEDSKISPMSEARHRWVTYIVFCIFWKSRWNHRRDHLLHSQKFWGCFTGVIRLNVSWGRIT